jgi:hypothetical protein
VQRRRQPADQDVPHVVLGEDAEHRFRIEARQLPLVDRTHGVRTLLEGQHVEQVLEALAWRPREALDDLIEVIGSGGPGGGPSAVLRPALSPGRFPG